MQGLKVGKISLLTATNIVIANMIGTGVFTSLHFQISDLHNGYTILILWLIGGIAALCGALVYAEIGTLLPRSGGEYTYLSETYHPSIGFLAGWVSCTVGFSAPIAASAIAMGKYTQGVIPNANPELLAAILIILMSVIHLTSIRTGSGVQNFFTLFKIIVISILILFGLFTSFEYDTKFEISSDLNSEIFSPAFAISLFFVSYSYSGWNASAYLSDEIENPIKNLPRSLIIGTASVIGLYLLLNFVFITNANQSELAANFDVGTVAANNIFGNKIGNLMGLTIAILLISSVSSMTIAGPRVAQSMGEDIAVFKFLSLKNKNNLPYAAILFQGAISLIFVFTSTFEQVITYMGFTLNLFTFLTVAGIFILRNKKTITTGYRTPFFPLTPIIFLLIGAWILVYGFIFRPEESIAGLLTVCSGWIFYFLNNKFIASKNN